MKKIVVALVAVMITACKNTPAEIPSTTVQSLSPITDADMAKGILYEVNIRQFTNEGTFAAFEKSCPR